MANSSKLYWFGLILLSAIFVSGQGVANASGSRNGQKPYPMMLKFLGERMNMPKAGNIVTNEFQPQFRANMAQDSTTFTQVSTSFEGVMMGDGVFCDYDNDGDLDVIVCGWNDTAFATKIYCNDNGVFTDIHADIAPIGGEKGIA